VGSGGLPVCGERRLVEGSEWTISGQPAEPADAVLARRAGDGDLPAFELLVRRYSDRVFALALRMLDDRGEAEDVTQEAFIKAWKAMNTLTEPAAVRTWIFRIAHHECLAVLRKRKSRSTSAVAEVPEGHAISVGGAQEDADTQPERATESHHAADALRAALAQLPDNQRAVWLLAEVDGLSYAEIARVVGSSEQAVRGRLSRCRAKLAGVMQPWR